VVILGYPPPAAYVFCETRYVFDHHVHEHVIHEKAQAAKAIAGTHAYGSGGHRDYTPASPTLKDAGVKPGGAPKSYSPRDPRSMKWAKPPAGQTSARAASLGRTKRGGAPAKIEGTRSAAMERGFDRTPSTASAGSSVPTHRLDSVRTISSEGRGLPNEPRMISTDARAFHNDVRTIPHEVRTLGTTSDLSFRAARPVGLEHSFSTSRTLGNAGVVDTPRRSFDTPRSIDSSRSFDGRRPLDAPRSLGRTFDSRPTFQVPRSSSSPGFSPSHSSSPSFSPSHSGFSPSRGFSPSPSAAPSPPRRSAPAPSFHPSSGGGGFRGGGGRHR
jgi:hypothetical protein